MTFLGIFFIILLVWTLVRYEVNRTVRKVLLKIIKETEHQRSTVQLKTTSTTETDNRFIFWHQKEDERDQWETSFNEAYNKLHQKNLSEKEKKYNEYLNWCKKNHIKPRYKSPNDIDHVY